MSQRSNLLQTVYSCVQMISSQLSLLHLASYCLLDKTTPGLSNRKTCAPDCHIPASLHRNSKGNYSVNTMRLSGIVYAGDGMQEQQVTQGQLACWVTCTLSICTKQASTSTVEVDSSTVEQRKQLVAPDALLTSPSDETKIYT